MSTESTLRDQLGLRRAQVAARDWQIKDLEAEVKRLNAALQQIANEAQYPPGTNGKAFAHLTRIYDIVNTALDQAERGEQKP